MTRRLIAWLLAASAACWTPALRAQNPAASADAQVQPDRVRNAAGDSKPLALAADQIATWNEGSTLVVVLRGKAFAQQDSVRGRFQQGVAWIETKQPGVKRVTLFGEGAVTIENGSEVREGGSVVLEFITRGDNISFKSGEPVVHTVLANDPFVRRATAYRGEPLAPSAVPPQPVAVQPPPPPLPPVQRTSEEWAAIESEPPTAT